MAIHSNQRCEISDLRRMSCHATWPLKSDHHSGQPKRYLLWLQGPTQSKFFRHVGFREAWRSSGGDWQMSLTSIVERRGDRVWLWLSRLKGSLILLQRDDPGNILMVEHNSGQRSHRELGMSKNQVSKKYRQDNERIRRKDLKSGGVMALLWNVMRQSLPPVIIADYDKTIEELDLPRLETPYEDGAELELGDGQI